MKDIDMYTYTVKMAYDFVGGGWIKTLRKLFDLFPTHNILDYNHNELPYEICYLKTEKQYNYIEMPIPEKCSFNSGRANRKCVTVPTNCLKPEWENIAEFYEFIIKNEDPGSDLFFADFNEVLDGLKCTYYVGDKR